MLINTKNTPTFVLVYNSIPINPIVCFTHLRRAGVNLVNPEVDELHVEDPKLATAN